MRGRDPVSGLPREATINSAEMRDALEPLAVEILDSVKDALENTPPELAADLTRHGILMAGGGAMLRGFRERLEAETGVPVRLADDPLTCVALGAGRAIEEIEVLERAAICRHITASRYSPRNRSVPSSFRFSRARNARKALVQLALPLGQQPRARSAAGRSSPA